MSIRNELLEQILAASGGAVVSSTGWAQYNDTSLSSGSPQVILEGNSNVITNNAGTVIDSQLPPGVTSLYDSVTQKVTPETSGDAYMIRIAFTAFTSSPSGLAVIEVDIGGAQGIILERSFTFPKGTGLSNATQFSSTNLVYTLGTFVANGGDIKIRSETGDTSIYDVSYVIDRVHKAI